jgi:hypothetical protein
MAWRVRNGDLPLMYVSEVQLFDVTWRGTTDVVWVRKDRHGSVGPRFCEVSCEHVVRQLAPGRQYRFRVRAHSGVGWSQWSGASSAVGMPQLDVPATPQAPTLATAGDTFVNLVLVRRPSA